MKKLTMFVFALDFLFFSCPALAAGLSGNFTVSASGLCNVGWQFHITVKRVGNRIFEDNGQHNRGLVFVVNQTIDESAPGVIADRAAMKKLHQSGTHSSEVSENSVALKTATSNSLGNFTTVDHIELQPGSTSCSFTADWANNITCRSTQCSFASR